MTREMDRSVDPYPHRGSNHPLWDWGRVHYQLHQVIYASLWQGGGMGTVGKIECEGERNYSLHEVEGLRLAPLWWNRFRAGGRGCLPGGGPPLTARGGGLACFRGGEVGVRPCGGWGV